jgi:HlyD family secretion protein
MSWKKKIIILITIILVIAVSYEGYRYFSNKKLWTLQTTSESKVVSWEFVDAIRVTGTAKLAYEQKLRFSGWGKVSQVYVKSGQEVKKWKLLATLDMQEYDEIVTQAEERASLARQKLQTAREKIGGLELKKLEAELWSLESKKRITSQDLQKLIKTAPLKTEMKEREREQKESEIASKEASYTLDYKLWEKDRGGKEFIVSKKIAESKKIISDTMQNAISDVSEIRSIQTYLNTIFGFDRSRLTSEEGIKSNEAAWNAPGLRADVETVWKNLSPTLGEINGYIENLRWALPTSEQATKVTEYFIRAEEQTLQMLEYSKKALDNTDPRGDSFTVKDIESLKSTINGFRTSTLTRLSTRKDNKNLLPLISSDDLVRAQVEKDFAEKKLALDAQKITIEKLKIELIESRAIRTGSGALDPSVRRDIDTKRQELLDIEVSIASKSSDIRKQSSWSSDEIISLESETRQTQSELNKALSKREQYEMRAPIDGMIRSVKMLPGDTLSTSSTTGNEGTIIIEDSNAVVVVAKLGQKDIVRIRQNQEARITVDAFADATFTGSITEISSSPEENTNGGETLYEIRILFDRGTYAIYSGMSANIEIYLDRKNNIIFVPLMAVTTDAATWESTVIVISTKGQEKRIITIGKVDGDRVEVVSWLQSWEKVLSIDFSSIDYQEQPQWSMIP